MAVIPFENHQPDIAATVWVAPNAWITGKVQIADNSSVFFGAALRGDIQRIIIGKNSNIQDNAVLHTSYGLHDLVVGNEVTVGHGAILHGCTIKDRCIIGMHSTILDDAVVGEDCIVGANALVTMRTVIPPRSLVIGSPAKAIRQLTDAELKTIVESWKRYVEKAAEYQKYFEQNRT